MTYQPTDLTNDTPRELSRALDQAIEAFQQLQDARATPGAFLATREQDARLCEQVEDRVRALGYAVLDFIWRGGELVPRATHEEVAPPTPPANDTPEIEPRAPEAPKPTAARASAQAQAQAQVQVQDLTPESEPEAQVTAGRVEVEEEEDEPELPEVTPLAPAAPPVAITPDMLARLQASFEQTDELGADGDGQVNLDVDERWMYAANHLDALVTQLGKPGAFRSKGAIKSELGVLRKHTSDAAIARWGGYPAEVRLALSHFIAARCRALQVAPLKYRKGLDLKEEVAEIFPRLRAPLERERLGFVHGLALEHRPAHGDSWRDDVNHHSKHLARLREKYAPTRREPPRFCSQKAITALAHLVAKKASAVAIREDLASYIEQGLDPADARVLSTLQPVADIFPEEDLAWAKLHAGWEAMAAEEAARAEEASVTDDLEPPTNNASADTSAHKEVDEERPVDASWSHWDYVSGRSIAIIGGDCRVATKQKIEEVFEPSSLSWPKVTKKGGMRRVKAMCERIENHSVELVLVLNRFISHKASKKIIKACKKAGVPYACLERGYGVVQMIEAIERFLPPNPFYLANRAEDAGGADGGEEE